MAASYYAEIKFDEQGNPYNSMFEDIYFCPSRGIAESEYVFITHNNLNERFKNLTNNSTFIIAETGFGSGLNFLITLNLWKKVAPINAKLFYISFEKYPIHPKTLKKILANFPELKEETDELISQYYLILPSSHRMHFQANVFLDLIIGDINSTIKKQNFKADCWFLDGFAPSRNSEMWNEELIKQIALFTKLKGSFATFSASSKVRKRLIASGFNVEKTKGFNKKREMLCGFLEQALEPLIKKPAPWFERFSRTNSNSKVIITGGGLSGACSAYSLARRGYKVTLYEKGNSLAAGASGNPQGILYGRFFGDQQSELEFDFACYKYSHNLISKILNSFSEKGECGLIQVAATPKQIKQYEQFLASSLPPEFCKQLSKIEIEKLLGLNIKAESGLFFPYGLWINPKVFIEKLCKHPNITIVCNQEINDFEISPDGSSWNLYNKEHNIIDSCDNLVIATSYLSDKFHPLLPLSLRKIRGQVSLSQNSQLNPKAIICGHGYITPPLSGTTTIGATFKLDDLDTDIRIEEHQENIDNLKSILDDEAVNSVNINELRGRAGIRAFAHDHLPLIGPIADFEKFKNSYSALTKDANSWLNSTCPYLPGIFVNIAQGAKGILRAPLSGEIIADYIDNTPFCINEDLRFKLHPNRLWVRKLVKKEY